MVLRRLHAPRHALGLAALALVAAALAAPGPAAGAARVKGARQKGERPLVFSAVPWLAPADTALARLGARGYRDVGRRGATDVVLCRGRLFDRETIVEGTLDEQRRVVRWVVTLIAGREDDPYGAMRRVYDDVVEETAAKYGGRWDWAEKFDFPYEKGDGREAEALRNGGAAIRSEWQSRGGDRLTVAMDREASVVLTYECPEWAAFQDRLRGKKARDL